MVLILARRGRLVLLGSPRGHTRAVNFYPQIHVHGISIIGVHADVRPSRGRCPNFWSWKEDADLALQLMAAGRLQVEPMISEINSWKQAAAAYDVLKHKALPKLGLLLDWGADGNQGRLPPLDATARRSPILTPTR